MASHPLGTFQNIPLRASGNNVLPNTLPPGYQPNAAPQSRGQFAGPPAVSAVLPNINGNTPNPDANLLPNMNTGDSGPNNDFFSLDRGSGLVTGLSTLSDLANAIAGFQQVKLNKEAFAFNQDVTRTNVHNQAQVTNAATEDRARAVAVQRGTEGEALNRVVAQQLSDRRIRGTI